MKILGIDTSSRFLSIALSEDKNIIREENTLLERRHAAELVPRIKEMLKKSGLSINDVDAFVIGLGPGSFTGLRIGVSTVKGFGIATGKPCIGIASMDAIAMDASDQEMPIVPVIDAKRENVYSCVYKKEKGILVKKTDFLLLKIEEVLKKVKGDAVFLGDAVALYKEKIKGLNKNAIFLDEKFWYPKAGNLIRIGSAKIKKYKKAGFSGLIPIYIYPKDCQVKGHEILPSYIRRDRSWSYTA